MPKTIKGRVLDFISPVVPPFRLFALYRKYRPYSMIPRVSFCENLAFCRAHTLPGCVIECGVWRGGMSAAISEVLPGRLHYLFDSFEGLPQAQKIDGAFAIEWQKGPTHQHFDNCRAERSFAEQAMAMGRARRYELVQGWFSSTMPTFTPAEPVSILRLDGDWYESTMTSLTYLFPHVVLGGLIIIDDYYAFDGCAKAVHDYLSQHKLADRINQSPRSLCYIKKRATA